jgi:hypothetical protein
MVKDYVIKIRKEKYNKNHLLSLRTEIKSPAIMYTTHSIHKGGELKALLVQILINRNKEQKSPKQQKLTNLE